MSPEKVALFQTTEGSLALNSADIEAIVEATEVFQLPQLPEGFSGVCVDHGRLIPVIDDRMLPGDAQGESRYLVVCRSEYGLVAVPVFAIEQIVENDEGTEEGPGDPDQPGLIGFFLHREDRYPMINIDLLLGSLN